MLNRFNPEHRKWLRHRPLRKGLRALSWTALWALTLLLAWEFVHAAPWHRVDRDRSAERVLLTEIHGQRISNAVRVHTLRTGTLPPSLGALVESGLLHQDALRWPRTEESWQLRHVGEEARPVPPRR